MSYTSLSARAYYYHPSTSNAHKTSVIVGIVCGIFAIAIGITVCICRKDRRTHYDPESALAQSERRREDGGWWGAAPAPSETATERRARIVEARASRGVESGIEREARGEREAREGEPAPPMYQLPAPVYYGCLELGRQYLTSGQQLPHLPSGQENDAPPAYDSTAVWPTRA